MVFDWFVRWVVVVVVIVFFRLVAAGEWVDAAALLAGLLALLEHLDRKRDED